MKTIWKYTLRPLTAIDMPIGAEVLSVHEQLGEVCLWAMVDPDGESEVRKFELFGTGHSIPDLSNKKFVGTSHLDGGALVLHVFEHI